MTSYFSNLLWGTSQLDDAVDKATSELLPTGSEDIALNLEISDQIRSKSISPKDAMRALKRRLNHKNPNVQLLSLGLTDTCVKNGGDPFLLEVASREFVDNLVSILKIPALNHDVKTKILRLIQNWATAFEGKANLSYMGEVYRALQHEGFNFPPRDPTLTSSAMVDTQTAPEWIDSDVCLRCRTSFSFTNRKHHCRNCGQVFDQQCSSKVMALPHFGIAQEVRVCDSCHAKLTKKQKSHRTSQSVSTSRHRSARDFADAELQRAIQLSLEEVGAGGSKRPGYVPSPSPWQISEPPLIDQRTRPHEAAPSQAQEEDDPDLRAAIEASLREANAPRPSAPLGLETPRAEEPPYNYATGPGYAQSYPPSSVTPKPTVPTLPNYDLEPLEEDAVLTFSQTVEQLQQQGGRDLSRYPAVTELYDKANGLRPKLAMSLGDTGRKHELLADMHDKLSQAVKLYDKLLTEQVSHQPWRASTSSQPAPYAPQYQGSNASYNSWAPPQQGITSPRTPSAQPSYFPAPERHTSLPNGNYVSSPLNESSQQMYHISQATPVSHLSPTGEYATYAPPQQPVPPPPVTIPAHSPPAMDAAATSVPTQSSQLQYQYPQQVSQPTYPVQSAVSPAPGNSLARHNPVATYIASPPPSVNAQSKYLGRANTMSHTPAQLQQLQQTSVPQYIPDFPAVPNVPPQAYQSYNAPAPEPEREALLIDF